MKLKLRVGDQVIHEFDGPEDMQVADNMAMTILKDNGKTLMLRFVMEEKTKECIFFGLESAFSPSDEHITELQNLVEGRVGPETTGG